VCVCVCVCVCLCVCAQAFLEKQEFLKKKGANFDWMDESQEDKETLGIKRSSGNTLKDQVKKRDGNKEKKYLIHATRYAVSRIQYSISKKLLGIIFFFKVDVKETIAYIYNQDGRRSVLQKN
jgi:hypothetical protein